MGNGALANESQVEHLDDNQLAAPLEEETSDMVAGAPLPAAAKRLRAPSVPMVGDKKKDEDKA